MLFKPSSTITLTFAPEVESNAGMEILRLPGMDGPAPAGSGLTPDDLRAIATGLAGHGIEAQVIRLNDLIDASSVESKEGSEMIESKETEEAAILVIRGGIDALGGDLLANQLYTELEAQDYDTMMLSRGKVMRKVARHCLVVTETPQEPDVPKGKGRVLAYKDLPFLSKMRTCWSMLDTFIRSGGGPPKLTNLFCELNHYYGRQEGETEGNAKHRGIGWHGDGERRVVAGARVGLPMALKFAWYMNGKRVSDIFEVTLNHGDLYIMSEKATGNDWKKTRNHETGNPLLTLRHCAGFVGSRYIKEAPKVTLEDARKKESNKRKRE